MTVYYYKGAAIVAPLTIESNEPLFVGEMLNLKQERVSQQAQRWELTFGVNFKDNEDDYFADLVYNSHVAKQMVMPQLLAVDKKVTAATELAVTAFFPQNSQTVDVYSGEINTLLPRSSFIKFSNHSKIYMLTEAVTTNSGTVQLSIYPKLTTSVDNTVTVQHPGSATKPMLRYYTSTDSLLGVVYEDGVLINPGTVKLIEAL